MDGTATDDGPGDAGVSGVLRSAAEGVMERWRRNASPGGPGEEEFRVALEAVAAGVQRVRKGSGPAGPHESVTDPVLASRVSRSLRGELLRQWRDGVSEEEAREILDHLWALERVWTSIRNEAGRDSFVTRLSEPGAFELVVGLAHDLRSPLSSVLFLAETLRSGHSGPLNDLQKSQLGFIYGAAFGVLSIADDVMEMAKAHRGLDPSTPAPFSIREILETLELMVRPMAEEKDVRLDMRMPPDLQPRLGQPELLSRVLLNLTTNALKFTEEGSVTVTVEEVDPEVLRFSVEDTGRGISAEQAKKLFEPFRYSSNQERHFFSSSGLGLATVRRLLGAMDSEIEFDSEEENGTCFHFRLRLPVSRGP